MADKKSPVPSKADVLRQVALTVADENKADFIIYSGVIHRGFAYELCEKVEEHKTDRPNVVLYLSTLGGSADAAYQIARCLQHHYRNGKFEVFVPTYCKSAGTLIALGADEIIMADMAELGPLDVQILKQDEMGEYTSGLTPTQALSTLKAQLYETFEHLFKKFRGIYGSRFTTKTAALIAARLAVGCFGPIYQQVDPMRLGEQQRAMTIASNYGLRLSENRQNLKDQAISRLVSGYPSHDFVIDRNEAMTLFRNVRPPSETECLLMRLLDEEFEKGLTNSKAHVEFLLGDRVPVPDTSGGGGDGKDDVRDRARDGRTTPTAGRTGGRSSRAGGKKPPDRRTAHPGDGITAVPDAAPASRANGKK